MFLWGKVNKNIIFLINTPLKKIPFIKILENILVF